MILKWAVMFNMYFYLLHFKYIYYEANTFVLLPY